MKLSWLHAVVLSFVVSSAALKAQVVEADLCIFGGTSGGIAAAVQAARLGKTAVLVNPTKYLGGLTTGGLGATDIGNKAAIGGLSRDYYHRLAQHYAKDAAWTLETAPDYFGKRRGGQAGASALTGADATMWTFEPHVAEQVFLQWLDEAKTPVFLDQRLKHAQSVPNDLGIASCDNLTGVPRLSPDYPFGRVLKIESPDEVFRTFQYPPRVTVAVKAPSVST